MLGRSAASYCRHWHRKCSNSAVKPCALNSRGKLSLVCGWLNIYEVPGRQLPVQQAAAERTLLEDLFLQVQHVEVPHRGLQQ